MLVEIPCKKGDKDQFREYISLDGVNTSGTDVYQNIRKDRFKLYNEDGSWIEGPFNGMRMDREWAYKDGKWTNIQTCFKSQEEIVKYRESLKQQYDYVFALPWSNVQNIELTNYMIARTKPGSFIGQSIWQWEQELIFNQKEYELILNTFNHPKNLILYPAILEFKK